MPHDNAALVALTKAVRHLAGNLIDDCVAVHGEASAQNAAHGRACVLMRTSDHLVRICEAAEERAAADALAAGGEEAKR